VCKKCPAYGLEGIKKNLLRNKSTRAKTRCSTRHAPFHQPQCPFIQTIDTDVTLLPTFSTTSQCCPLVHLSSQSGQV
jgi:hypothetical protein